MRQLARTVEAAAEGVGSQPPSPSWNVSRSVVAKACVVGIPCLPLDGHPRALDADEVPRVGFLALPRRGGGAGLHENGGVAERAIALRPVAGVADVKVSR